MDTTPGLRDMLNTPRPVTKKVTAGTKRPKEVDAPVEHDESYDPRKREPQYAHAEKTCLWELVLRFVFPVSFSRILIYLPRSPSSITSTPPYPSMLAKYSPTHKSRRPRTWRSTHFHTSSTASCIRTRRNQNRAARARCSPPRLRRMPVAP